jgi:hypothetical protein
MSVVKAFFLQIKILQYAGGDTATCAGIGANSKLYNDVNFGNVCFWVSNSLKNIADAQTECMNKGGYLATITDTAMESAVHDFLQSVG